MNDYLSDLYRRLSGKMKLGLRRSEEFMEFLDHPQKTFRSIHIAGTNGKGSTTMMCEVFLRAAGFKTGRFISPHLIDFNERIQIRGEAISDDVIKSYLDEWKDDIDRIGASFFEITTALAFAAFRDAGVNAAVVETGLGGRLDATSVLIPDVSVISRISYDHMRVLGNTLAEIAGEKAGIIKQGIPLITCRQHRDALDVLLDQSHDTTVVTPAGIHVKEMNPGGMILQFDERPGIYQFPLAGRHHLENLALALKAVEVFLTRPLTGEEIEKGLQLIRWRGRFELLQKNRPAVIYDVGHNEGGAAAVCDTLREVYPGCSIDFLLGVMRDKDVAAMLRKLKSIGRRIAMFPVQSHRALTVLDQKSMGIEDINWYTSLDNALNRMMKDDPPNVLVILGSHYPAAEIYEYFKK